MSPWDVHSFLRKQVLKSYKKYILSIATGSCLSFLKLSCLLSRSYLKANKYTGRAEQLMNGVFPFQKRKKLFFGPTKHGSGRWKVDSKISQELDTM